MAGPWDTAASASLGNVTVGKYKTNPYVLYRAKNNIPFAVWYH